MTSIQYDLITTNQEFQALQSEWDTLLGRSEADGFFLSWDYVSTWWSIWSGRFSLAIWTARDADGALRGIAPMAIGPGRHGMRRYLRHLTFMGGATESLAEYGDFIIEQGEESEIAAGFARHILASKALRWDILELELARAGSAAMRIFQSEMGHYGEASRHDEPAWICTLESDWEAFLAKKSGHFRQKIRNRIRTAEKKFTLTVHRSGHELTEEQAFAELLRLNQLRWGGAGSSFHTERFIEFHRRLFARLHPQGKTSIRLLQVDGKYVAARYDFIHGTRVLNFQSGWDPAYASHSVNILLLVLTLQQHMANGLKIYDFMSGAADYKSSWSDTTEPLKTITLFHPRSLRVKAYEALRWCRNLRDGMLTRQEVQAMVALFPSFSALGES